MAIALRSSRNSGLIALNAAIFAEVELSVPVLTLNGGAISVNLNDAYVEPGYTATDENDGVITGNVVVTGSVDTATAGTYTLTYTVTNSVGNTATATRIVTVQDFWEYVPPQQRILDMSGGTAHVTRDPDSQLSYWLDMSDLVGQQSITSLTMDPENQLSGINVTCNGINTQIETDNLGDTYTAGKLIGLCVTGGIPNAVYKLTIRYTLSGGDVDDRTVVFHVMEQ